MVRNSSQSQYILDLTLLKINLIYLTKIDWRLIYEPQSNFAPVSSSLVNCTLGRNNSKYKLHRNNKISNLFNIENWNRFCILLEQYAVPKQLKLCLTGWKGQETYKQFCGHNLHLFFFHQSDGRQHWPLGIPSVWETCGKCQQLSKCHSSSSHYHCAGPKNPIFSP